jgi:Skp family chaperone for outer membrane proteins
MARKAYKAVEMPVGKRRASPPHGKYLKGSSNMSTKRNIISVSVGLFIVFLSIWALHAQDASKPASPPTDESMKIAIVDVNKIYKESDSFKKQMEKLKSEADAADKQAKDAQKLLAEMTAKLTGMTPGSEEYTELQKKIVSSKSMLETEIQLQGQDFLKREAALYHSKYQEIENAVAEYSQEHQIDMVLRFIGDPVDEKNPNSVLANINKPIVWHGDKLDITPAILQKLSEKQN